MDRDQVKGWIFKITGLYKEIIKDKALSLKECNIRVAPLNGKLGEWSSFSRTITISEETLLKGTWDDIIHILKHEMAHQIVDEIYGSHDQPHGELFGRACQLLGISPKATYSLGDSSSDPVLRRIEKLMALSKSSNENEALLALTKAQELSFKYNVDLLNNQKSSYNLRPLGKIRRRTPSYEWKLINILSEFYFIKALHIYHEIDGKLFWQFEIYGTPCNIDTAEYVYFFMMNQAEILWKDYLHENGKSVSRKRTIFMNGLYEGFKSKLSSEREVLKNKYAVIHLEDPQLNSFFRERNPRISTRKITIKTDQNVYNDGMKDGKSITINPGIAKNNSKPVAYLE